METIYWIIIIAFAILQVLMIIKFFQIAADVRALKMNATQPETDYKKEFAKWIAAREPGKAKEVLMNEIGCSDEFSRLLRGGNEKYVAELKEKIRSKYKSELDLLKFDLDLEDWI